MGKTENTDSEPKAEAPTADSHLILPIEFEDEPISSIAEKARITATVTSPPLPALVSDEANRDSLFLNRNSSTNGVEEKNLTRLHAGHFRDDPVAFVMQLGAFYQGTGWRSYKNYIGTRILYDGYTEETKERVLNSERVRYMIAYLAEKQTNIMAQSFPSLDVKSIQKRKKALEQELQAVARTMVDKLVADLNSLGFIRFFGFFVNNILVRMYHQGIRIHWPEFLEVRRVAIRAAQNSHSLIILPCHKSHIDYLVISWIFFRLGLALPHIAAGDNLDLPIVGGALRRGGAFFIRRIWGEDQLYASVVKEYVEGLLERGHNIECFIEGTRSRTGKLLPPKLGILKIVLDCILSGKAKDCWIVPMSIQYDKVIETESFYNELLGNPKEKESLWGIVTNTRLLQLKMGRIDVRFAKPYSLQLFLKEQIKRRNYFDPTHDHQKITLLRALGYRVLSEINAVSVVMPTALVGTIILTLRGRGVGRNELVRRVEWLRSAIRAKGGRVDDFGDMTTEEVVDRAIAVLKDLIKERRDLLEPVFYAEKRFELSFYRNQVMHLFVSEAILSAAMYTKIKQGGAKSTQRLTFNVVLEEVTFLSKLLKVEFVYHPGKIKENLEITLDGLKNDNVFAYVDDFVELSDTERKNGREIYDFYCFLIWPFIETYWLAAIALFSMTPPYSSPEPTTMIVDQTTTQKTIPIVWFNERDFHNKCQLFGKTLYYQGDLSYFEAISKETLKNAFIRYEQIGIIKVERSQNSKVPTTIALCPDYVPTRNAEGAIEASGKLWDFVEHVGKFRREGKNRRDNMTVSSRVLRLAEMVGMPSTADVGVTTNLSSRPLKAGKPEAKL
ncbi:12251_t:CDS:10 [Ambispora gerdemannii]|uniref:12251_t:CDS:1 n=1 Tax=Ambispora gerdemannii TaxID=144530 RepID=A0A9N9AX80_9GLOM|nr:12251_t:CDS:10 [Ambispora gerdemannii]